MLLIKVLDQSNTSFCSIIYYRQLSDSLSNALKQSSSSHSETSSTRNSTGSWSSWNSRFEFDEQNCSRPFLPTNAAVSTLGRFGGWSGEASSMANSISLFVSCETRESNKAKPISSSDRYQKWRPSFWLVALDTSEWGYLSSWPMRRKSFRDASCYRILGMCNS